jgi:hypothetical protein
MPPETKRLHEGLIRAAIQAIRAWQDWVRAKNPPPASPGAEALRAGEKQALQ